jgi:hypothetical protein
MDVFAKIIETYPELSSSDFGKIDGKIILVDDGDGIVYIAKWNYDQPIPAGLKLGK